MKESRRERSTRRVLEAVDALEAQGKPEADGLEIWEKINELHPPRNRLVRLLRMSSGDLYPSLHRLEREEKLGARWEEGTSPRRRLYRKLSKS